MYKLDTTPITSNYIFTNYGYKQIQDTIYNDKIYDINGTFKNIQKIISKKNDTTNSLLSNHSIVYTDYTLNVDVSENHLFMTKFIDPRLPLTDMFDLLQSKEGIQWVPANQLRQGHVIALSQNTESKLLTIPVLKKNKIIQYKLNHSRLWFLLGYFLHYGVFEIHPNYKNCIRLTIYDQKEEELLDYLDEFIISNPTIFSNGLNDACVYRLCLDETTYQILSHLIDKKSVPEWIHSGSRFYLYSFIHGFLYNVHGVRSEYNINSFMYTWTIYPSEIVLKNINIELLLSLQSILFKCDIVNSIQTEERKTYNIHKMIIYKEKKELYPFFNRYSIWVPYRKKEYNQSNVKNNTTVLNNENHTCVINNVILKYAP